MTKFQKGELVIHPIHGPGIIEAIEEKKILNTSCHYYILKLMRDSVEKIMIPVTTAKKLGIRRPETKERVEEAIDILKTEPEHKIEKITNWSSAYRQNMNRIKTGDILEIARVLKLLWERNKEKPLGLKDEDMMNSAKKLLVYELALTKNLKESEAEVIIEEALNQ